MTLQRRHTPRVNLGPEHTLRFNAGGHAFQGVRIANLSEGGCFITVPRSDAGVFRTGTRLEQLRFEGPGLPQAAVAGTVAFVMGASQGLAIVGVGVTFHNLPENVRAELARFVVQALPGG